MPATKHPPAAEQILQFAERVAANNTGLAIVGPLLRFNIGSEQQWAALVVSPRGDDYVLTKATFGTVALEGFYQGARGRSTKFKKPVQVFTK
jgi:hypothetical protein